MLLTTSLIKEIKKLETRDIVEQIHADELNTISEILQIADENPFWQMEVCYILQTYFPVKPVTVEPDDNIVYCNRDRWLFSKILNNTRNEYMYDKLEQCL